MKQDRPYNKAGLVVSAMTQFVLASGSPRRRELLKLLDYPCRVIVSYVDEEAIEIADPAAYVLETARQKATAVAHHLTHEASLPTLDETTVLIAADTTVALKGAIMGKPADEAEARYMLEQLRGPQHDVFTGVVVARIDTGETAEGVHHATVAMRPYSNAEIERYIATGDPFDKAGAYSIQHPGFRPVAELNGCYLGIMGLSICHWIRLLTALHIPPRANTAALIQAHRGHHCPLLANNQ